MTRHALLGLLLVMVSTPAAAARLRAERAGGQTYLVAGQERVLLWEAGGPEDSPTATSVSLRGGYRIALEPGNQLAVTRGPERVGRIDYAQVMGGWLAQDDLWGGHKRANDLRYFLRAGTAGPLSVITDLTPTGSSALAVATWRSGGSGYPIAAQYLVRLVVSPTPALEPVRELDLPEPWSPSVISSWDRYLYQSPGPRLFARGKLLLQYAKPGSYYGEQPGAQSELVLLGPDGTAKRTFTTFPAWLSPVGLVAGRWLVLVRAAAVSPAREGVWLLDLADRRLRPLSGKWRSRGEGARVTVPASGHRIAIARALSRPAPRGAAPGAEPANTDIVYVVLIPSGKTVVLPGAGSARPRFWKSYAIAYSSQGTLNVYRASTGRLLATLPLK